MLLSCCGLCSIFPSADRPEGAVSDLLDGELCVGAVDVLTDPVAEAALRLVNRNNGVSRGDAAILGTVRADSGSRSACVLAVSREPDNTRFGLSLCCLDADVGAGGSVGNKDLLSTSKEGLCLPSNKTTRRSDYAKRQKQDKCKQIYRSSPA